MGIIKDALGRHDVKLLVFCEPYEWEIQGPNQLPPRFISSAHQDCLRARPAGGLHKHLTNKYKTDDSAVERRLSEIEDFGKALEQRLHKVFLQDWNKPLPRPMVE